MTQTQTRPYIEEFPVLPAKRETNREAIIRVLREADGVVEQCYEHAHGASESKCAGMAAYDGVGGDSMDMVSDRLMNFGLSGGWATLLRMNDTERLTFAEIADRLADDKYWNEKADLPYKGER